MQNVACWQNSSLNVDSSSLKNLKACSTTWNCLRTRWRTTKSTCLKRRSVEITQSTSYVLLYLGSRNRPQCYGDDFNLLANVTFSITLQCISGDGESVQIFRAILSFKTFRPSVNMAILPRECRCSCEIQSSNPRYKCINVCPRNPPTFWRPSWRRIFDLWGTQTHAIFYLY